MRLTEQHRQRAVSIHVFFASPFCPNREELRQPSVVMRRRLCGVVSAKNFLIFFAFFCLIFVWNKNMLDDERRRATERSENACISHVGRFSPAVLRRQCADDTAERMENCVRTRVCAFEFLWQTKVFVFRSLFHRLFPFLIVSNSKSTNRARAKEKVVSVIVISFIYHLIEGMRARIIVTPQPQKSYLVLKRKRHNKIDREKTTK